MEPFLADIINDPKVSRVMRFMLLTLLMGFIEFICISVALTGVNVPGRIAGGVLAAVFFGVYLYLTARIFKRPKES